jgi:acetylornithine deacetylase
VSRAVDGERALGALEAERLIETLRTMLRFRSFSASPGELELAGWLAGELRGRGIDVEQREVPGGRLNTLGWLRGSGAAQRPSLMLNGHIDTNMAGLGWTRDPWGADVDGGFVYGLGASNMKAADAAMIEAVTAVHAAGLPLRGDVCLALVVGELQGGVGTLQLLADGVRTECFIVGEPTDLAVLTLHAGSFEFFVNVLGRSRHLSKAEEAISAVDKMCGVVARLRAFRFAAGSRAEYASLQRLNVGSIRGGVGREAQDWRAPQVPDFCTIRVAGRIAPDQTPERALAEIEASLRDMQAQDADLQCEIGLVAPEVKRVMPPFEVDPQHPFVRGLVRRHAELSGKPPAVGAVAPYRYYGTDAGHLAAAGMTGVVYGPGGAYNTMADERVSIDDLVLAARAYALAIVETCGAG